MKRCIHVKNLKIVGNYAFQMLDRMCKECGEFELSYWNEVQCDRDSSKIARNEVKLPKERRFHSNAGKHLAVALKGVPEIGIQGAIELKTRVIKTEPGRVPPGAKFVPLVREGALLPSAANPGSESTEYGDAYTHV